jgi:hypothetical protein
MTVFVSEKPIMLVSERWNGVVDLREKLLQLHALHLLEHETRSEAVQ